MFRSYVFTEMPYPYLPPASEFESARVTLPNRIYDPELGYQLYEKYFDLYAAGRPARPRHHGQRAPLDGHLRRPGRLDSARDLVPRDEQRPDPLPREPGRQPASAPPGGRRDGHDRRHLAWTARLWVRPWGPDGALGREQQPRRHEAPVLGGDRPDRQGLVLPRWSVQLGGRVLPLPTGQRLATSVSGAPSTDLGTHPDRLECGGGRRTSVRAGHHPQRGYRSSSDLRRLPAAVRRVWIRLAGTRDARLLRPPLRRRF